MTAAGVRRISISLQPELYEALDRLVEDSGYPGRSQAVSEMIALRAAEHQAKHGDEVVAGTITLFYDESRAGLSQRFAAIQRRHVNEVISSQRVLLENHHTMEVLLVQGPADRLRDVSNALGACRGVRSVQLSTSDKLLPPLHAKPHA